MKKLTAIVLGCLLATVGWVGASSAQTSRVSPVTTITCGSSEFFSSLGSSGVFTCSPLAAGSVTNAMLAGSITASKLVGTDIATLGTITAGAWNASVIAGQYGGTGVANTGKTITLGGNLTTSGAFAATLTLTGTTNVTLPTTGTLATLAGSETFTNKTITSPAIATPSITGTASIVKTSAGAETIGLALANNSGSANTAIGIDFDPTNNGVGVRTGQIVAIGNGSNAVSFIFRLSAGSSPAELFRMTSGGLFTFGGVTVGNPALAASGADLRCRLADNSGYCNFDVAALKDSGTSPTGTSGTGYVRAGSPTFSGTISFPGSGQISSSGRLGLNGTPTAWVDVQATDATVLARGVSTSGQPAVGATAHDYFTSFAGAFVNYYGSAVAGTVITGVNKANAGVLNFQNTSAGVIGTNGGVPLVLYTTSVERIRVLSGGNTGFGNTNPQALVTIGTTAGTARVYNAFTDASNGEWAYIGDWGPTANVATFGTDKNGTGTTRNIQVMVGGTVKLDYGVGVAATWTVADGVKMAGISTSATVAGSLCRASDGTVIYKVGVNCF